MGAHVGGRAVLVTIVQCVEFCAGVCWDLTGGWETGMFREGFPEEVTSKLSPEGWKGLSQVRVGIMCSWRGEYVQRPKCGEWDLLENLK